MQSMVQAPGAVIIGVLHQQQSAATMIVCCCPTGALQQ
jgi:hypothetical protein